MTTQLLDWYDQNKRFLPWRDSKNPYLIWVSEIIMQQTQIKQGLPYYLRFVEAFPNVIDLANVSQTQVLVVWQGLGYYSRARNMHATAKYIAHELNGVFPSSYDGLIKLKGIGPYTAAAIASVCYYEPVLAVDGNVQRVISRLFGIETAVDRNPAKLQIVTFGNKLMSLLRPGDVNQALMDLGAMVCTPKQPKCSECCFVNECSAYQVGKVHEIPVKTKSKASVDRYMYYFVVVNQHRTIIQQRTQNDIWQGLYEFPVIESAKALTPDQISAHPLFKALSGDGKVKLNLVEMPKHILSHQCIYASFILLHQNTEPTLEGVQFVGIEKLGLYPFPRLTERFIAQYLPTKP